MENEFNDIQIEHRGRKKAFKVITVGNLMKHFATAGISTEKLDISLLLCKESPEYVLIWKLKGLLECIITEDQQDRLMQEIVSKVKAAMCNNNDLYDQIGNECTEQNGVQCVSGESLRRVLSGIVSDQELDFFLGTLCQNDLSNYLSLEEFLSFLNSDEETPEKPSAEKYDIYIEMGTIMSIWNKIHCNIFEMC